MNLRDIFLAGVFAQGSSGAVSPEQINQAVSDYLEENPVSAGREWRLLNTVSCDGTASEYVFTKDDNGKDYHLEEISIYIYGYPAYNWGRAGELRIDINKDGDNRSITTITNNVRCFIPIYANRFSGGYIAGDRLSNSKFPMESIDYVALNMGLGSQIFPSGWKIYVYGKDISGV